MQRMQSGKRMRHWISWDLLLEWMLYLQKSRQQWWWSRYCIQNTDVGEDLIFWGKFFSQSSPTRINLLPGTTDKVHCITWNPYHMRSATHSITVEPRYVEPAYLEHAAMSNCFSLPLAQINPGYLELYYGPKKHWPTSVRKCSQGTSWQDVYWKLRNVLTCSR